MLTHRATRRWRGTWALAISLISAVALMATAVFVPGAGAIPEQKTYTADVSPHPVGAGQTIDFTLTVVNTSGSQQIGSVNLTAPSTFSLISTGVPSPAGTATKVGSTGGRLELRNLALPPSQTMTVTFTAEAPCVGGNYLWSIIAKQSNNFSGPPGNTFTFNAGGSNLLTTVSGQCSLDWLTQPADTRTDDAITGTPYDDAFFGQPGPLFIQVEVISAPYTIASPTRVSFSSGEITLQIDDNPGGLPAMLDGTTLKAAVNGVATFNPGPEIDQPGPNYTLLATNPIMVSGESTPFDVSDAVCQTPCTTPETAAGGTRARVTSNSPPGGFVAASVGVGVQFACDPSPSPNGQVVSVLPLDVTQESTMLIETTFSLAILDRPWSQVRACLASAEGFTQADGTPTEGPITIGGEFPMFVGVPPDCDNQTPVPPCFLPSLRNNRTDEITIRLLVPGDDPHKR